MRVKKQLRTVGLTVAVIALSLGASVAQAQQSQSKVHPNAILSETPNSAPRKIKFNGRPMTQNEQLVLERLEKENGKRLPNGNYWYDNRTGLMGLWKGPAEGTVPPGLGFGGTLPAKASGGGTKVFVNGRELHPLDVARIGAVDAGRYWLDANGDWGLEGGPIQGNLLQPRLRHYDPIEKNPDDPKIGICTDDGCVYPEK